MTERENEPIDLSKRRADKLREQKKRQALEQNAKESQWSGAAFAAEVESIELSEDVLKGIKTFMCTIAAKIREVDSTRELQRPCFGLALLLMRDYDRRAFDKLLKMIRTDAE
jgi:hypothetical protein